MKQSQGLVGAISHFWTPQAQLQLGSKYLGVLTVANPSIAQLSLFALQHDFSKEDSLC